MRRADSCRGAGVVATVGAVVMLAGGVASAADSDLSSAVSGPPIVVTGGAGTYTVQYGNAGPDEALSAYCNLEFPAGVPAPISELTQDQIDFIEASASDTAGNRPLLFIAPSCEALLIQDQGPTTPLDVPLQGLTPGASHSFSIATEFPMSDTILAGGLRIDGPDPIAGSITNLGHGSCSDCSDIQHTCFGEPLASFDLGSRLVELVDDGSADPTYGCNPLTVTTGAIALIDRGGCDFGLKVLNAENGGAAGVIIANNGTCSSHPASPDCVIGMGPGDFGELTSIPAVMVSQNQGDAIKNALPTDAVAVTLGGIPTSEAVFSSLIFSTNTADTDPDGANNSTSLTTVIDADLLLADGFESGDLSGWTSSVPGR